MLLYYITDRAQFPGNEAQRRGRLLEKIAEAARSQVDYIQLREKDLSACDLESLARQAAQIVNEALGTDSRQLTTERRFPDSKKKIRLLINSRTDIALASGADGVHLRSDDISPTQVRKLWQQCVAGAVSAPPRSGPERETAQVIPTIAVSCHTPNEVARAAGEHAAFAVFAPVFEKHTSPSIAPTSLESLRLACHQRIPVLALGGITLQNTAACIEAGAAGIAAIRLFQENNIPELVRELRHE